MRIHVMHEKCESVLLFDSFAWRKIRSALMEKHAEQNPHDTILHLIEDMLDASIKRLKPRNASTTYLTIASVSDKAETSTHHER
jgi:hypothetical protein